MNETETQQVTKSFSQPTYQPVNNLSNPSVKDWLITLVLLVIPFVNIILLFVWAFSSNSTNDFKRNYARANLILMAVGIGLYILFLILMFVVFGSMMSQFDSY